LDPLIFWGEKVLLGGKNIQRETRVKMFEARAMPALLLTR
jgi:hypothetical protein